MPPSRGRRRHSRGRRTPRRNGADAQEEHNARNLTYEGERSRGRHRKRRNRQRNRWVAPDDASWVRDPDQDGNALELVRHGVGANIARVQRGRGRGRGGYVRGRGRQDGTSRRSIIDSDDPSVSSMDSDVCTDYVHNVLDSNARDTDNESDSAVEHMNWQPRKDFGDEDAEGHSRDTNEQAHVCSTKKAGASSGALDEEAVLGLVKYASKRDVGYDDITRTLNAGLVEDFEDTNVLRKPKRRHRRERKPKNSLYGEKVTGKGLDMLRKMGWKDGDGLGANADGRTEPIGVEMRRSRRGLGRGTKSRTACPSASDNLSKFDGDEI